MNTSYLATCCRALHGQMEYPTDELVVHLVRAQQLSQSISQGFARRKTVPNESQIPQAVFIQGLRERIRTFAAALPPHIRANRKSLTRPLLCIPANMCSQLPSPATSKSPRSSSTRTAWTTSSTRPSRAAPVGTTGRWRGCPRRRSARTTRRAWRCCARAHASCTPS